MAGSCEYETINHFNWGNCFSGVTKPLREIQTAIIIIIIRMSSGGIFARSVLAAGFSADSSCYVHVGESCACATKASAKCLLQLKYETLMMVFFSRSLLFFHMEIELCAILHPKCVRNVCAHWCGCLAIFHVRRRWRRRRRQHTTDDDYFNFFFAFKRSRFSLCLAEWLCGWRQFARVSSGMSMWAGRSINNCY